MIKRKAHRKREMPQQSRPMPRADRDSFFPLPLPSKFATPRILGHHPPPSLSWERLIIPSQVWCAARGGGRQSSAKEEVEGNIGETGTRAGERTERPQRSVFARRRLCAAFDCEDTELPFCCGFRRGLVVMVQVKKEHTKRYELYGCTDEGKKKEQKRCFTPTSENGQRRGDDAYSSSASLS